MKQSGKDIFDKKKNETTKKANQLGMSIKSKIFREKWKVLKFRLI